MKRAMIVLLIFTGIGLLVLYAFQLVKCAEKKQKVEIAKIGLHQLVAAATSRYRSPFTLGGVAGDYTLLPPDFASQYNTHNFSYHLQAKSSDSLIIICDISPNIADKQQSISVRIELTGTTPTELTESETDCN